MVEKPNLLSLGNVPTKVKQHKEKQSFITVANLVTTLLTDLEKTYI